MWCKKVLFTYPLVGPNQEALIYLNNNYPQTVFSTLVDHQDQLISWISNPINLYIDINVGMKRTDIKLNKLSKFINLISRETCFNLVGIHAYYGHNNHRDLHKRKTQFKNDFTRYLKNFRQLKFWKLRNSLWQKYYFPHTCPVTKSYTFTRNHIVLGQRLSTKFSRSPL